MILCYIDESGTPDVPGNTSHYVLAGISIPINKWRKCEKEIFKVKAKYSLEDAEIHTGWLIRLYKEQNTIVDFDQLSYSERRTQVLRLRHRELLRLNNPKDKKTYHQTKKNYRFTDHYIHLTYQQRIEFVTEIASVLGAWTFCRLFAECIDKIHFDPSISRLTIDEQAFEQIVSRFEQYLKIYSKSCNTQQYGLLIHDNNQTVSKRHTELMKSFHRRGTLFTSIKNIIETPLFVDSQLTNMVQLADVCSYALRKYLEKNDDSLFKIVFQRADTKNGKVVGVRHFSDSTCNCQICHAHK